MVTKRGKGDYPNVYRPCRISEIYGQKEIKQIIGRGLDEGSLAQSLLFSGVSGTGKTTIARIIALGLNCDKGFTSEPCCGCHSCNAVLNGNSFAFQEYNAAYFTSITHLRKESQNFDAFPLDDSRRKIVLFDECHRISNSAQDLLLKIVEEPVQDNHYILCSTEPKRIIDTLKNRCMVIEFEKVANEEIKRLLLDVCKSEQVEPSSEILERIIEEADGMPRNALFLLQKAAAAGKLENVAATTEIPTKLVKMPSVN